MIFNKTKKGSAELYNLTGTWYKANDFTGISEDIVLAQNEVIKLIGKATFDRAHSRYMTDEYDPEVSPMIQKTCSYGGCSCRWRIKPCITSTSETS